MSTHTKWIVDEGVPEVVCFVDSASDKVRARFVNASEVEQLKALVRDMHSQLLNAYDPKELDEFEERMRDLGVM